jgi:hypothetical protein
MVEDLQGKILPAGIGRVYRELLVIGYNRG